MDVVSSKAAEDRIRSIRDEYRKRTEDLKLKHSQQLRDISQKYANDINGLSKKNSMALQDFRQKAKDSLNAKDEYYQSEMHKMRVANRRHLEAQVNSLKAKSKNQINSLQVQMNKDKQINQLQQNRLKKTFSNEIQKKDSLYQDLTRENAIKSRLELERRTGELRDRHEQVQRDIAADRDSKLAAASEDMQKMKSNAQYELSETKRLLNNRLSNERRTSLTNLLAEREAAANINSMQRDAFAAGIEDVRERYQNAYEKDKAAANDARKIFEDQVNERQLDRIGGLESQIIFMKKIHDGEKLKMRQELDQEKKMLAKNYRDQLKNFDDSRENLINKFNKMNHDEISGVIREKDIHFKQQMRRMKDDMTTRDMINRQALTDLRTHHEARSIHVESQADQRVKSMQEELNRKLGMMEATYKDRIETQKDDFQESQRELRLIQQDERAKLVNRFHVQAKDREKFYDDKIKNMKLHHKTVMEQQQRDHERSVDRIVDAKDRRFSTQRRAYQKQIEAMKLYYEEKIAENEKSNEEEVQRLKRGHEEQVRKMVIAQQGFNEKREEVDA